MTSDPQAELTDRVTELETLLRHALPIIGYVSRGMAYTWSKEPYPDAAARRLNALIQDALPGST